MRLYALRGATTAAADERSAILSATDELMRELLSRNGLEAPDLVSCLFTLTADLSADPERLRDNLLATPGVRDVGVASFLFGQPPLGYQGFVQEGDGLQLAETPKRALPCYVFPITFAALGFRLVEGRLLTETDVVFSSGFEHRPPGREIVDPRRPFDQMPSDAIARRANSHLSQQPVVVHDLNIVLHGSGHVQPDAARVDVRGAFVAGHPK